MLSRNPRLHIKATILPFRSSHKKDLKFCNFVLSIKPQASPPFKQYENIDFKDVFFCEKVHFIRRMYKGKKNY